MIGDALSLFHFLRPLWLLALPLVVVFWWYVHRSRKDPRHQWRGIAPHLAAALQVGKDQNTRFGPLEVISVIAALLCVAVAGPTWSRAPNPLVADTAPLVIALKVTDSMEQSDLAPSRLDRSKFKILDLIEARAGARTALVAYSGTAHRVAPLTEDPNILRPLLEGLTPEVMPVAGDAAGDALELAGSILQDAETAGAVLFVLDDMEPGQVAVFSQPSEAPTPPVLFLTALPEGQSLPQLSSISNATTIAMSADNSDVATIERRVRSAYVAALAGDDRLDWEDRGWLLAWPAALLTLLWFRRGWSLALSVTLALLVFASPSHAEGWRDWFWTPDQQGQRAYDNKDYAAAADLFEDPYLSAHALYKSGQYAEAANQLAQLDTPEAAFAEGMARIRNREYRPAIAAFETALERRPGWPEAEHNLELSKVILDYVETTREQSDTGEESGIGADDVVFDNEASRGADTTQEYADKEAAPLSADQWISTIDTDMTGFLRSRFLLENRSKDQ